MKNRVLITNARIVMPDRIIPQGQLIVEEGCIDKINRRSENRGADMKDVIDAEGSYLLPGFVDIHSDAIEKEIERGREPISIPTWLLPSWKKNWPLRGLPPCFIPFLWPGRNGGCAKTPTRPGLYAG